MEILVLNGPNLNLLGTREPEIYGSMTLDDINRDLISHGKSMGITVTSLQSNHEGELVEWIQQAESLYAGVIINAGAFTHTSVALHDALRLLTRPIVEVHLSNIFARESFRHHSYISALALGVICGFGAKGYILALDALSTHLSALKEIGA